MSHRRLPIPAAGLLVLLLAGCGSTEIRHVTTTITRSSSAAAPSSSSSSTTTTTATTSQSRTHSATTSSPAHSAAAASSLERRSPRAVLGLAAAALGRSGGYAMRADLLQNRSRTTIDLTASGGRRYQAALTTGPSSFSIISVPGAAYLRGNVTFWRRQSGATVASRLAGHWLHVPDTGARSVTRSLGTLAPGTLARCLTEDHGTLSFAGRTTVAGRPALVIRDAGNAPGATPSTTAIATGATPYPLLFTATGKTRRGGRIDVCNDGKGDGATGTIALSQFDDTPAVSAPATAGSYGGGSST